MTTKSLLQSKTFWVAVAQALAGGYLVFASAYPEIATIGFVLVGKSLLDAFLRSSTDIPVTGIVKA